MKPLGKKSVNIDSETHRKIAIASAQQGVDMYELVAAAWATYTASEPAPPVSRRSARSTEPWHDKLDIILSHGSERDKIGIQANIDWAVRSITGSAYDPSTAAASPASPDSQRVDTVFPGQSELAQLAALIADESEEARPIRRALVAQLKEYSQRRAKAEARTAAEKAAADQPGHRDRQKRVG